MSEKIDIVYKVLIDHELLKDVAREYRVGIMVVHRVVKKAQSNPRYLEVAVE